MSIASSLLAWFRGRPRHHAPTEPQQVQAPGASMKPFKVSSEVAAWSRSWGKRKRDGQNFKPFGLPVHPPGVGPAPDAAGKKTGMAMDEDITATNSWANQLALQSVWQEGITFLGYAYLSELAQRPEYRMISETLASEMTRRWIRFTGKEGEDKADRIAELEAEFKRLNVRDIFCRAAEQDGFFGRGHLYIDTGDSDNRPELMKPLGDGWDDMSKAKVSPKRPIRALKTIEAVWCYPTSYNSNDPLQDNWYRPDQWYVQAKIVHASRLLTFIGREVPDLLKPTYSFGGLSMSQMAKPYVDNWLTTRQSVNDLIKSFTVYVLKTNLQETLQADGQQLLNRGEIFNNTRTNSGLMMIDSESEDFMNVSASLAGLHELQAQAQEHMSAVAHTPTVKLLGIQPAGLNADSDGVMRAFYDYVHAYQEHFFRAPLHTILGFVMLSLWGETDDGIDFEFEPLWTLDEEKMALVRKEDAEADQILVDTGVISPKEVRKRLANDPDSGYNSIDVDDVPDLLEEEVEGLVVKGGAEQALKNLGEETNPSNKDGPPSKEAA